MQHIMQHSWEGDIQHEMWLVHGCWIDRVTRNAIKESASHTKLKFYPSDGFNYYTW